MDYSHVGEKGARDLLAATRFCPKLARVWLHGNTDIPAALLQQLGEKLRSRLGKSLRGGLSSEAFHSLVSVALERRAMRSVCSEPHPVKAGPTAQKGSHTTTHDGESLADCVARLAIAGFRQRCPPGYGGVAGSSGGRTVVAAFVEEDPHGSLKLVALGSGTRFMNAAVVAAEAGASSHDQSSQPSPVVKDSHAEMLARRALIRSERLRRSHISAHSQFRRGCGQFFRFYDARACAGSRYFHAQLYRAQQSGTTAALCPFELTEDCLQQPRDGVTGSTNAVFRLRHGFRFHFYTSTAPCGAASSHTAAGPTVSSSATTCLAKAASGGASGTCEAWTPGHRKSCTDKIRRWLREGCQGKHLVPLLGRVPVASVTVGLKFSTECVAALQCAAQKTNESGGGSSPSRSEVWSCEPVYVWGTKCLLETLDIRVQEKSDESSIQSMAVAKKGGVGSGTMVAVASLQGKGGNSDACFVWSIGDGDGPDSMHVHDGRTGLTLDGRLSCCCPQVLAIERGVLAGRTSSLALSPASD